MTDWHAEAVALREQGFTITEIAQKMGYARGTVHDVVAKLPCPACGGPRSRTAEHCRSCEGVIRRGVHDDKVNDVAALYNEGASQREIATYLGYGPNSTPPELQEARRRGLIGHRHAPQRADILEVRKSLFEGCVLDAWDAEDVAAALGLTRRTAAEMMRLRRRGVKELAKP